MRWFVRSKITHAIVKEADVNYIGSITIDEDLIEKSGLMNGAAAHLIKVGEEIIIMGFELSDQHVSPKIVLVDPQNKFIKYI